MKSSTLSLAALAPLALAATFEVPIQRRGVSKHSYKSTKAAVLRDIARKQARYFPELASKNKKRSTGSVTMTDVDADTQYYGGITVGTPGQVLNVILDTGSADLVLAQSPCSGCETGTTLYNPTSSSTYKTSSESFSITYGTGSASGTLVTDTVSFGGIIVPGQTFAGCTDLNSLLTESYESGLLGLGWKALANSNATPLLQQMWESNLLDEPVFAMAYATFATDSSAFTSRENGGVLSLGGVDGALYSGNITYNPLVGSPDYWSIKLDDVLVNGVSLGINSNSVIIDSGTTLISMPASAVSKVYSAVGNSQSSGQLMTYSTSSNPSFALVFGGVTYTIPSFSYGEQSTTESYGIVYDASEGTSTDSFIIGDAFLKSVYSVFNFEIPAVGFAPLNDANSQLESNTEPTTVGTALVATATSASTGSHSTTSASHNGTASSATAASTASSAAASASGLGPLNQFGGALSGVFSDSPASSTSSPAAASSATVTPAGSTEGAASTSGSGRLRSTVGLTLLVAAAFAGLA